MGTRWRAFLLMFALALAIPAAVTGEEHRDDWRPWKSKLRSGNKWDRARAVRGLASCGGEEALELVLGALSDHAGEVADQAQLALAQWPGEGVLAQLMGRAGLAARQESTRWRAAELLGRHPGPIESRCLLRGLADRDATVRRMLLWSIERAARAGRLGDGEDPRLWAALVRRLESDRDPGNRARALCALEALDPKRAAPLVRGIDPGAPRTGVDLRATLAHLAPRVFDEREALANLRGLLGAESAPVHRAALRALGTLHSREAAGHMIDALAEERDARLRDFLVSRLRALSGLKHRADARPWRGWWSGLAEGWSGEERVVFDPEPATAPEGSRAFVGLPLLSTRVCFLIDFSGSMWTVAADGRTRKEQVGERLGACLERLGSATRFNLILFSSRPRAWRRELVPASARNVRSALDFFERCADRGSGNLWEAIELALTDHGVDSLVVLTDGVPTGGAVNDMQLLGPRFVEANLTRQISVDSILVDAPADAREHWARLARGTLGRSIAVEL